MFGSSKARSGEVFGVINEMYKKRKLPRDLKPWRTYYLLQLDPTKFYPDEFDEEDAENAVKYAEGKGVPHESLVMFFGEMVRRDGKKLFDLPLTVETSDRKEVLHVPIFGARDFGSFREVVHVSFLLAHPDLPCDTPRSAFSVLITPQVEMTLRYGVRKKNVTIDPFEVERGDRRVASIAFGAGVKDNETELLSWKVLPHVADETHAVNEVRREALHASPDPTQPVQLVNPLAPSNERRETVESGESYAAPVCSSKPDSAEKRITTEEVEGYSSEEAGVYLALNFFFGAFGLHRFYLKKASGILYLLSFFFCFGFFGLLSFIDLLVFAGGLTRDKEKRLLRISSTQKKIAVFCACVYFLITVLLAWFVGFGIGCDHVKKEMRGINAPASNEQPVSPAEKGV